MTEVLNEVALAQLKELDGDDGESLLVSIFELYIADAPEHLTKITKAIEDSNGNVLSEESHKLKSTSANIGAEKLTTICQTLETYGSNDQLSRATELLPEFQKALEEVLEAVQNYKH